MVIAYKTARAGVLVLLALPAYSFQTCHRSLPIGQRKGKHFRCVHLACVGEGDTDSNAADGITLLGTAVDQPRASWLACQLQGSQKPSVLAVG